MPRLRCDPKLFNTNKIYNIKSTSDSLTKALERAKEFEKYGDRLIYKAKQPVSSTRRAGYDAHDFCIYNGCNQCVDVGNNQAECQ